MSSRAVRSPSQPTPLLPHLVAAMSDTKRTRVKDLLYRGLVHVNGQSVTKHDRSVGPRDRIEIRTERAAPARELPFKILYEDAALVAIDKPNGLLTIGTKSEKNRTVYALMNRAFAATRERAYIVHRLDRYTSGVLILAKTMAVQDTIKRSWKAAEKVYHALVEGSPFSGRKTLVHYLREDERLVIHASDTPSAGAVKATLSYQTIQKGKDYSLLKIDLETGKKNQIRAQLAAIGNPIAGDAKYGAKTNPIGRLCLHASSLSIPHPTASRRQNFEAPMPPGMADAKWFR